jgi:hypothetical protein
MSPLFMIPLCALQISLAAPPADARANTISSTVAAMPAPAAPMKANPETAKLHARIDTAIAMLEAGENRRFLEAFVEPEYLEQKTVDAILEEFEEEKVEILLSVLKEIRTKKPTYKEKGTVAVFKLKKRPDVRNTINFIKVDGVWYLRN